MASSKEIQSSILKRLIKKFLSQFGYEIKRINNFMDRYGNSITEASEDTMSQLKFFSEKSLATIPNLWSISQIIKYISDNNIEGDIVECGIYNGSTLAFISKNLKKNNLSKNIWGYDTFEEGFLLENYTEKDLSPKNKKQQFIKKNAIHPSVSDIIKNINELDNYDENIIKLIKGDILKTLNSKSNIPDKISFLRMDTDIYATTLKQLEVLYPKLAVGGILHIDDYGMCPGVRMAVDEYFSNKKIWLHRVDLTCRYLIKT